MTCSSHKLQQSNRANGWWIPNKAFTISHDTRSLMAGRWYWSFVIKWSQWHLLFESWNLTQIFVHFTNQHGTFHQLARYIPSTGISFKSSYIPPISTVHSTNQRGTFHQPARYIPPTGISLKSSYIPTTSKAHSINQHGTFHQTAQYIPPTSTVRSTNQHSTFHQPAQYIPPISTVHSTDQHATFHQRARYIPPTSMVQHGGQLESLCERKIIWEARLRARSSQTPKLKRVSHCDTEGLK